MNRSLGQTLRGMNLAHLKLYIEWSVHLEVLNFRVTEHIQNIFEDLSMPRAGRPHKV